MLEKDAANKIKRSTVGLRWKPLSDKYGQGIPDRVFTVIGVGWVGFVELKAIGSVPARRKKVGLKGYQARWLQEHKDDGGNSFLIIAVGSDKILIVKENFVDVAKFGIEKKDFNLINYSEVEAELKKLCV